VDRLGSDLIVMGTISRAGIAGLSVGNTAERMLGHLDCSMLTVKPADFVCPVHLD
jgi:universal stress protein E